MRFASDPNTADHEIAKRILDMFAWNVSIPDDKNSVKVEHGWVTLSGTVDWYYQSDEARKAAGKVNGVVGVSNLIDLRKLPTSGDIKDRIVAAFKRNADLDAASVTVLTDGGNVTLGGNVRAWNERHSCHNSPLKRQRTVHRSVHGPEREGSRSLCRSR